MKVFQSRSGRLLELKEEGNGKPFDYERLIQNLVEKNLSIIFPSIEFLTTEYQIDNLRPDSIAFDTERNSFVIIEYKNVKNRGVLDQGISYYQLLKSRPEAFVLLYHKVKGKVLDSSKVNWDETRVIFISPFFDVHQRMASQYTGLPIELYEISRYENGLIMLDKIESEIRSEIRKAKNIPSIRLEEYDEDEYLAGGYGNTPVSESTKALYLRMRNRILDTFPELEIQQKKKYAGFYSRKDGSAVCTISATKTKLNLCYSTTRNDILPKDPFIADVSKKGHWGIGHFMSTIENDADIEKAVPFIKRVFDFKVK